MHFITLVLSLPTENATLRMRAWRAVKSAGAAALRDGVYLLPDREASRDTFAGILQEVQDAGGTAYLLPVDTDEQPYIPLFDRTGDYEALVKDAAALFGALEPDSANDALKSARKFRKTFATIAAIDFFPGEAQLQADAALKALEQRITRLLSPDEPHAVDQDLQRLAIADYQGRIWATRRRPWVDRLASAWLIRRFIDRDAKILWLETPADAPADVLGFDYDGAAFTHVGHRVTFEILAESFGIDSEAVKRVGAVVHFLDVGGLQPPEATGVESILKGMRDAIADDDALATAANAVFDGLHAAFGGA